MLADAFIKAHAGAKKVQARKADILRIAQRDNELLREFVNRFQRERMELPPFPEEWAAQAFTKGLNPRSLTASFKLKENLLEYEAVTWADVHNRYESKIRVEDDQLELPPGPVNLSNGSERTRKNYDPDTRSSRERYRPYSQSEKTSFRPEKLRSGPGQFTSRGDRRTERPSNSRGLSFRSDAESSATNRDPPRISEYNFSVNTSDLVSAIGRIPEARWPRPLRSDPGQRDPNMICDYHGTHVHRTEDCRQLREEVARLLKNGHLREFLSERAKTHYKERESSKRIEPVEPQHVINMIIGGTDAPRGPVMKRAKVFTVREKRNRDCVPEGSINFSNENAEGIIQPHNDALIVPVARVLSGLNMASETTKGEISLPVNIDGTIQQTVFYVIEGDMKYNALLGRPWIHSMRAVPSTLHQLLKFPTPEGIKTIRGEQPAAREMFAVEESSLLLKEPAQKAGSSGDKDSK
ncbi:uncharacterized protein LOC132039395 [Lycium ferocissimum]|uniref:uncharacterized protein LOC132039395 n=1 Tax=Lycium ferocissimum TaxID=112874 RepID=UPI002816795A|nr:uncharacterized protein LOC132039395 [Lycium ferocissimum]